MTYRSEPTIAILIGGPSDGQQIPLHWRTPTLSTVDHARWCDEDPQASIPVAVYQAGQRFGDATEYVYSRELSTT